VLILIGGFFDLFDGISARVNNRQTKFGAFLDSVLDRYSDSLLLLGFAWHFMKTDSMTGL
jgi:phosphatidylglycerophosphate synthase